MSVDDLRIPLLLMAVVGTLSFNYVVLLPLLAERDLGGSDVTYTVLTTLFGVGSLIGSLRMARRATIDTRFLGVSAVVLGLTSIGLAVAPTVPVAGAILVVAGYAGIGVLSGGNAVLQIAVDPAMRGRVLALYTVVFLGSTPIGGPIAGWLGRAVRGRPPASCSGRSPPSPPVWPSCSPSSAGGSPAVPAAVAGRARPGLAARTGRPVGSPVAPRPGRARRGRPGHHRRARSGEPVRTYSPKASEIQRAWHVVDAEGLVLGRVATEVARILRGKHKPIFAPHLDTGDFVIIVNADKIVLTSDKADTKLVRRHTGYPGGLKTRTYGELLAARPEEAVRRTVRGMLPKNRLGRQLITKLKVYAGPTHPHAAQQPQPLDIEHARRSA